MNFDDIPDGVLATIVAAAVGGYVGGLVVGIRANLTVSTLVGVIVGLSLATVLQLAGVEPIFGVEGYSLLYASAAGVATSWVVAKASKLPSRGASKPPSKKL